MRVKKRLKLRVKKRLKLPVKTLVFPTDLKKAKNGRLPAVLLVRISGGGKLHHIAARAWEAMHDAAMSAEGIKPFKPTSSADAYRSFPQQLAGFMSRYVSEPNGSNSTRHYLAKKYWLKKGMAPMATPATSNHGWGLAVDVWGANNGRLDWMLQNCDKYGFSWEIQSEPWHIRYVCGDKLPQAVLDYEAKNINL